MSIAQILSTTSRKLSEFAGYICTIATMTVIVLVSYTVFSRFLFNSVPSWAEELPRVALIWTVFFGAALCTYKNSHLRADLLSLVVKSPCIHRYCTTTGKVATTGYFILLTLAAFKLTLATAYHTLSATGLSVAVVYGAVTVGSALCIVASYPTKRD